MEKVNINLQVAIETSNIYLDSGLDLTASLRKASEEFSQLSNKEKAERTYRALQERKKKKARDLDRYLSEKACKSITGQALWFKRGNKKY